MKKGIKAKLIAVAAAIAVIGAGVYYTLDAGVPVSAFEVEIGSTEKLITETGSVEAANCAVISSRIQGQLLSVDVKEGDTVTEGDRIASYTTDSGTADIGGIMAQISGLKTQAASANEYAEKSRKLYEEGAMSFEEYNQAVTDATRIESQISALYYQVAGLSEARGSKGVIAPISGTVTQVFASEGEIVAPGAPLIEISDMSDIVIKVNLISDDADIVALGNTARIYGENNRLIDGEATVSKMYIKAKDVLSDLGIYQKRVPVEITSGSEKNLRLGSSVNIEIIVDNRENVVRIPRNALFEMGSVKHVYTIQNNKATLRSVKIGLEGEKYTEITEGLSVGEMIITSPGREVEDGKAVKIKNDQ